jgi:hypothetical protein
VRVNLNAELERIAALAGELAAPGEELSGVLATEADDGHRVYLCAFEGNGRSWVALDRDGRPLRDRALVRSAISVAALCELAEESAGGGHLDELRLQLATLRETEQPEGIEEAEAAVADLQRTLALPPRLASPAYLDAIGVAARRLERALGEGPGSPFAEAMKQGLAVVAELERDVLGAYKGTLG